MKHGLSGTRIYRIWQGMKQRCNNQKLPIYKWYGAKGIKVCKEWDNDVQAFYEWSLTNGYKDNLTIDRIDSSGDYSPENCRWISQAYNASVSARKRWNSNFVDYSLVKLGRISFPDGTTV